MNKFLLSIRSKNSAGFTLIETLVSMFIFVLVVASVSQIFTRAFSGYRYEKSTQESLESAQFAMNTMAKELRTSSIVAFVSTTDIKFIDYSQGKCFEYQITAGTLTMAYRDGVTKVADCGGSYGDSTIVASGIVGGRFSVVSSNATQVGRVTISLQVGGATASAQKSNIQTSVSLRDYNVSGV